MSLTQSKEVNSLSKRYSTHIERRITRTVMVGDIAIGSDYPVRVQSMINEDTMDVENAYLAIKRLHDVGCEIVRLTVPSLAHAKAVGDIKARLLENNINTPLVADVHHNGMKIAMEVAKHVDKVRIFDIHSIFIYHRLNSYWIITSNSYITHHYCSSYPSLNMS